MVTRAEVYNLLVCVEHLDYVYERCIRASTSPFQNVRVKGQNFLLDALQEVRTEFSYQTKVFPSFSSSLSEVDNWIEYLDNKYEKRRVDVLPMASPAFIDMSDASRLCKVAKSWKKLFFEAFLNTGTVLIEEENFIQVFDKELILQLDNRTKSDLFDGFYAILNLIPTPAVMILYRVAESIVRQYYELVTDGKAGRKDWNDMLDELRDKKKYPDVSKAFLSHSDWMRLNRNDAEHPDKRYTQEESERVLLDIKTMLVELRKIRVKKSP